MQSERLLARLPDRGIGGRHIGIEIGDGDVVVCHGHPRGANKQPHKEIYSADLTASLFTNSRGPCTRTRVEHKRDRNWRENAPLIP